MDEQAKRILQTLNMIKPKSNSIAVFDIDSTLITPEGNVITPIVNAYKHSITVGLKPVIITARPGTDMNIHLTLEQLKQAGVTGYKTIYFLPPHISPTPDGQASYKLLARKDLHDSGYNVEISVGDMPWDIGEYGGIGFIV